MKIKSGMKVKLKNDLTGTCSHVGFAYEMWAHQGAVVTIKNVYDEILDNGNMPAFSIVEDTHYCYWNVDAIECIIGADTYKTQAALFEAYVKQEIDTETYKSIEKELASSEV